MRFSGRPRAQAGVSRARVTQVLGLLELAPEIKVTIAPLGDSLPRPIVTERMLRGLVKFSVEEQRCVLQDACIQGDGSGGTAGRGVRIGDRD